MARKLFNGSGKMNFNEQFYPARPRRLWSKARKFVYTKKTVHPAGIADAKNKKYIHWLVYESMLDQAAEIAKQYSASGVMWQRPFAKPRPRSAVRMASVWFTAYAPSLVTKEGESILATWGSDELWSTFENIGIDAMHTGPVKIAGGITGWGQTASIDGHFDRISMKIDPVFGNDDEFRAMTQTASRHHGIIIDDIIPGHTGKGFDFRLAEMAHGDYPGIYHMVEILHEDWGILPAVPEGHDSANLSVHAEEMLKEKGYIIGKMQRVIFFEPGVKETNWSATREVLGVDGVTRRWVYLHYFKAGQPSINWLDPSFAGMKLVIGDALHSIGELGSMGLRLDANGFLGVEKGSEDQPAWSEGHPLSEAANLMISGMVRKVGGFTFQELNLAIDDIVTMSHAGADLSYDFINRPAYHHALVKSDTEFLRMMMRIALEKGVDPASLVHALQNHDDLTFELVHFWTIHKEDIFSYQGTELTGLELRKVIRSELEHKLASHSSPYNMLFTANGIACTTATVIAASLGLDIYELKNEDINRIKKAHLLLAKFNAWQPGVFALSGWDLVGALTLKPDEVGELIKDGDTRWINRGGYDLLGSNPSANFSSAGMPIAATLYGNLKDQLKSSDSFVSELSRIIRIRKEYDIDIAQQVEIPDVSHKGMLVIINRLPGDLIQATVLNFSNEMINGSVTSEFFTAGYEVRDLDTNLVIATVDDLKNFNVELNPFDGKALVLRPIES